MTDIAHSDPPRATAVAAPPAKRPARAGLILNTRLVGVVFISVLLILWEIAAAYAIFPPIVEGWTIIAAHQRDHRDLVAIGDIRGAPG